MSEKTQVILQSPSFKKLLKARAKVRIIMTALSLFSYAFFVGGIVLYRDWFASPVIEGSSIPIGIPATVLVICLMVLLQYLYIKLSENYLDVLQKKARKDLSL